MYSVHDCTDAQAWASSSHPKAAALLDVSVGNVQAVTALDVSDDLRW